MIKSPFKFLDSYTREDRSIFFGRDQEITELYRRVFESRILLVYGISGTGKSSLINCGLTSRFDESDWLPVNVRRGNNIIESLEDAINKQAISPLKKNLTITEKLQSIYLDHFKPVYLVFDQFEELFIFGTHEERTEFTKLIKEIVRSKVQCRIVVVIREEFLAGITEFEEELPEIFSNRFRVEKMKRANAILAVEGPCKVHNIITETGFSEELVDKLIPSGQEIELTFLQIYLDRVFRLATSEQPATRNAEPGTSIINFPKELLIKAGSVSDLLGQFLEEQIREMDDPETGMSILKSFVSVQGTRRPMTEKEIIDSASSFGTAISEPELLKYLSRFVDLRLLRERDEAGHFELRHDALAAKIFEKFTAIEKDIIEVKQFIENAFSTYEKRRKLLAADDLKYINPYEDKLFLSRELGQFIIESKGSLIKALRRRRRVMAFASIFLILVFAFFTGWALNERKKAIEQSEMAEVQKSGAVEARDDAIKAQDEANRSKYEAVLAKDEAINQKSVADSALIIAENYRKNSDQQRHRAEDLYNEANDQRQLAQEAQKTAEKSAAEVLETNRKAMYQLYLFNAKEFANKSLLLEKNDTLRALLALNALDLVNYGFNNYSSGTDTLNYEVVILEALQKAYARFEPDTLISGEIWAINLKKKQIVFSNNLGHVLVTKLEEQAEDRLPRLKMVETIKLPESSFIRAIATDSLNDRIACATSDGKVFLITKRNSGDSDIKEIYKHEGRVLCLLFIPDKELLISASLDKTIRLWDINKRTFIRELKLESVVRNIVLQDINKILFSDDKGGIYSWNLISTGNEPVMIFTGTRPLGALAIDHTNKWLAVSSQNDMMIFELTQDRNLQPKYFPVNHTGIISSLKFSPDSRWLSSGSFDGVVMLWDMDVVRRKEIANIVPVSIGHQKLNILSINYSENSEYLIFGDNRNLHICSIGLQTAYDKLMAKMENRAINREEWEYYIRGEISFKSQDNR